MVRFAKLQHFENANFDEDTILKSIFFGNYTFPFQSFTFLTLFLHFLSFNFQNLHLVGNSWKPISYSEHFSLRFSGIQSPILKNQTIPSFRNIKQSMFQDKPIHVSETSTNPSFKINQSKFQNHPIQLFIEFHLQSQN